MSKMSKRLRGLTFKTHDDAMVDLSGDHSEDGPSIDGLSGDFQQSMPLSQDVSSTNSKDQTDELDSNTIVITCPGGSTRKMCDRARLKDVHNLPRGHRVVIKIDKNNVPCNKAAYLLGAYLSYLAKDGKLTPIHITRWDNVAFKQIKEKLIKHIESKFAYEEEARPWVLAKLNEAWRQHKSDLKAQYFDGKTYEKARDNPPDDPNVLPEQWESLCVIWNDPKKRKECLRNARSAKNQVHHHTGGRKSIARKRKEMTDANDGKEPDRITLWDETHKKKDGTYKNEETRQKMVEAHSVLSTRCNGSDEVSKELIDEVFLEVMGPEHSGRVRGFGCGLTPGEYYGAQFQNLPNSRGKQLEVARMFDQKLTEQQTRHDRELASIKEEHEKNIATMKEEHKKSIIAINKKHGKEMDNVNRRMDDMMEILLKLHPQVHVGARNNVNDVSSPTNNSSNSNS